MGGGPKRGKRKNKDDEQQWQQIEKGKGKAKTKSKWAEVLEQHEEPDAQAIYSKSKQIFDLDFSNQKFLHKKPHPVVQHRDKYADYTPEQLENLKKMKQQAKIDKQIKNKLKNQKRKQRNKQLEAQKQKQQKEKLQQAEQQRRVQQQIQKTKKKQNPWIIPIILLGFLLFMGALQYQEQIYARLSKFRKDDIDYYKVLEVSQGASDKEIKQQHKKLVLENHPDRNPNCQDCRQKFDQIMEAWQILGNPEKRQNYDRNHGVISEIKSSSITLTPHNYNYLVEQSKKLWIIQVYDSTSMYSRYFNDFWEEVIREYQDIVNFGRIDSWHQTDMLSYIPYRFQVFPGLYILDKGYSQICSIDHERPIFTIRRCIEEHLDRITLEISEKFPESHQLKTIQLSGKYQIKISAKLRHSPRVKAINSMYDKYFDFYFVQQQQTKRNLTLYKFLETSQEPKLYQFHFKDSSKKSFSKYMEFLQQNIVQRVSMCQFLNQCHQKKCILVLNQSIIEKVKDALPLPKSQNSQDKIMPIFYLNDEHRQFSQNIEKIKAEEEMSFEKFEIGIFENRKIDLGYIDQISQLDPNVGSPIQLQCKVRGWIQWLYNQVTEQYLCLMNK